MASAGDLFNGFIPTVVVGTAASPSFKLSTAGTSRPNPLLGFLKPTVTALDAAGNVIGTVAPYGEAGAGEKVVKGFAVAVVILGIATVLFLAGRASK